MPYEVVKCRFRFCSLSRFHRVHTFSFPTLIHLQILMNFNIRAYFDALERNTHMNAEQLALAWALMQLDEESSINNWNSWIHAIPIRKWCYGKQLKRERMKWKRTRENEMKVEIARAVETYIKALINWRWNHTSVGNSKYEPKMI